MTKQDIAISINDIHKEFILPQSKNTSFKQVAVNIVKKNNKVTQKVLDGVSFTINKGDFFGIVGRNGSGKSTLLKLIAGVYYPTSGSIDVNGGLTPFIELGVGFNPELSGRDNVYLNGALLGFTRTQMDEMYDEIVEFAELAPFMGQKLKNYSSGMQVRLAFAIAIKAKNDILVFDEVLAVGDEAFQRKCLDVFEKYKASRQTVILVTHEMATVKKFCNKAALISEGKLVKVGDPRVVADLYSELNQAQIDTETEKKNKPQKDATLKIELMNSEKKPQYSFKLGEKVSFAISWDSSTTTESVGIDIFKESGEHITGINSLESIKKFSRNEATLDVKLDLSPGKYFVSATIFNTKKEAAHVIYDGPRFSVVNRNKLSWSGLVNLDHEWASKKN
jgi:ABC-2 type transport system ATP-binding protein